MKKHKRVFNAKENCKKKMYNISQKFKSHTVHSLQIFQNLKKNSKANKILTSFIGYTQMRIK